MTHIPMLDLKAEYLYMKGEIDAAIARCLDHQKWILGPEVAEFEEKVAEYIGVKHTVGTSSGTDALVLGLRALAIKTKGQEYFDRSDLIITTPFTFTATGDAIIRAGATPLFVDIDSSTYNIDPVLVDSCLKSFSDSPSHIPSGQFRIVGIIPVHLYGQSCQMDKIMSSAREYGLFVVEDCAQAFGAKWHKASDEWQKVGSVGDIGCFSFFPSKNLGGFGDAGAITTDSDELAEFVRILIKHGGRDKYNVDHIGYNARLDTIQAAILLAKLKYIDEFNSRRRSIAHLYLGGLKDILDIKLPTSKNGMDHVYHQFTISIDGLISVKKRDALREHLKDNGIDSMIYYPKSLNNMKVFEGKCYVLRSPKEAERAAKQVLSLPIEPLFRYETIGNICESIVNFF